MKNSKNANNNSQNMLKNSEKLKKIVGVSVFSALAFVVALVCNVIPPIAGFLSLDAKDAVISIAAFIFGPVSGVMISFIAAFIEFLTFSTTGWYGFIMNFASSAVFSLTAASIYKLKRTGRGALVGLLCSVAATTGVMLLLNSLVTPYYLVYVGMSVDAAKAMVKELLPTVLLLFNLGKSLMNTGVTVLLYKPIITALRRAGLVKLSLVKLDEIAVKQTPAASEKPGRRLNRATATMIVLGVLTLLISVAVVIIADQIGG